jgi:hypothetical protein
VVDPRRRDRLHPDEHRDDQSRAESEEVSFSRTRATAGS